MRDPQEGYDCYICGKIVDDEYEYNDEVICSVCYNKIPKCAICGELLQDYEEDMCEDCSDELCL